MTKAHKPILVVEDDPDVRESLVALLESEGYAVSSAADGGEALTRRRSDGACMVVLALFMPVMNGCAFLDAQRQDATLADVPVVVITADPTAADKVRSRVVEALVKPLDHERLLATVATYC
jgi:CheY-like chemotaxis protein